MISHCVCSQPLFANHPIRVEVIYESTPVFAGEPVCIIVKFRHSGSRPPPSSSSSSSFVKGHNKRYSYQNIEIGTFSANNERNGSYSTPGSRSSSYIDLPTIRSQDSSLYYSDSTTNAPTTASYPKFGKLREIDGMGTDEETDNIKENKKITEEDNNKIIEEESESNITNNDNGGGWFGRRLSISLSNRARGFYQSDRSLSIDKTPQNLKAPETSKTPKASPNKLQYQHTRAASSSFIPLHRPTHSNSSVASFASVGNNRRDSVPSPSFNNVMKFRGNATESLLMGNVQLFGYLTVNDEIMDEEEFNIVRKRSIIGGKLGGIHGLDVSAKSGGLFNGITSGIGSFFSGDDTHQYANTTAMLRDRAIPIFSTPQSLMFGELMLQPGEVKSYLYSCELPKDLPPSYKGKSFRIIYHIVIVIQKSGIGSIPKLRTLYFPIRVFPNFDPTGKMLCFDLKQPAIKLKDEAIIKPLVGRKLSFKNLQKSVKKQVSENKYEINKKALIESLKVLAATNFNERHNFIDHLTVDGLPDNSIDETISEEHENENENGLIIPGNFRRFDALSPMTLAFASFDKERKNGDDVYLTNNYHNCRDNISTFMELSVNTSSNATAAINNNFPSMKNLYVLSGNGKTLAMLILSKPFFKTGETIHAFLNFEDTKLQAYEVTVTLETSEIISDELLKNVEDNIDDRTKKIISKITLPIISAETLPVSIIIPLVSTPQFSTSLLEVKWYLGFSFYFSTKSSASPSNDYNDDDDNDNDPEQISTNLREDIFKQSHIDQKGSLYIGANSLEINEMHCRVPLQVIPSNQDFGGLILGRN